MSRHRSTIWLVSAALLLAAPAPWALARQPPVRQSCDCCKLVCIEAEILKAKAQREYYEAAAKNKGMTEAQYEAGQAETATRGEAARVKYLPVDLTTCDYYNPNRARKEYLTMRDFIAAGYSFATDDAGTIVGVNYTLSTDLKSCSIPPKAEEYTPLITPCDGIGAAQLAHEQKHIDDCNERRRKNQPPLTPWETAKGELDGYDAELAKLEDLRFVAAAQCKSTSCHQNASWDKAADDLILSVEDVLRRGPHKPPSDSPTARKKGKGA